MEASDYRQIATTIALLGEPNRRRICEMLAERAVPNWELQECLPIRQSTIAHHLKVLRAGNLICFDVQCGGTRTNSRAMSDLERYVRLSLVRQEDRGGAFGHPSELERMADLVFR